MGEYRKVLRIPIVSTVSQQREKKKYSVASFDCSGRVHAYTILYAIRLSSRTKASHHHHRHRRHQRNNKMKHDKNKKNTVYILMYAHSGD